MAGGLGEQIEALPTPGHELVPRELAVVTLPGGIVVGGRKEAAERRILGLFAEQLTQLLGDLAEQPALLLGEVESNGAVRPAPNRASEHQSCCIVAHSP